LSSFHRWLELLFSRYLYIYENNVPVYFAGFYATGDTLRIAVESGVVKLSQERRRGLYQHRDANLPLAG
jgi:hypothetical protein